ncbi:MAG TPA: cation:proton antiporter, partial [Candidatus Elarobacter sp.]|nr:cation:proton antiporter [Candidatus Elarobacter sp.]
MDVARGPPDPERALISRAFSLLALVGLLVGSLAIGSAIVAQAPSSAAPMASWDSLYDGHRYFALRASVNAWHGPATPQTQYYRGLVAYVFNDPDEAIAALQPLVGATRSGLTPAQLANAADALGHCLRAVYRYRESAEAYRLALRAGGTRLDSATRADFRGAATLGEMLRSALPLRVTWTRQATSDTLPSDTAPYTVRAMMGGAPVSGIAFTPWTETTLIDSSTAATHGVMLFGGSSATAPRVGVLESLVLGPAMVSNVVVLVVPDADSALSSGEERVHGILGMDVMKALGRVSFRRDGRVAVSSPGARSANDSLSTMIALDGPIPVVAATDHDGADVPVDVLDTSAGRDSNGVRLNFAAMTMTPLPPPSRRPPDVLPTITYPSETGTAAAVKEQPSLPEDLAFVSLLFALFVIPKALQRYRIPGAITSLVMGAGATALGWFHGDPTLHLLSTFGIVALFLFAGLEIDGRELRRNTGALVLHGVLWSVLLAVTAAVAVFGFGVGVRPALLIALALVTPSTGFILSSLGGFGLLPAEQVAVKTYAVGSELLALTVLFVVLQSTSLQQLALALAAMIGVIVIIPLAFRFFAAVVAPHAPKSEFAFLLMVAVVCAYATRRLGVYYLVGAFLVGIAAQRFRGDNPAMSSEKMVDALESFG